MISGIALMTQSYLVTEDDNKKLTSNKEVFEWFVEVLDCAVGGRSWRGYTFAVIEVIQVEQLQPMLSFS